MPAEVKKEIELEIAHVLFLDIVGYSKLSAIPVPDKGLAQDARCSRGGFQFISLDADNACFTVRCLFRTDATRGKS
jgi:hypothetical protein